jgi:hypothetical protein
MRVWIQRRMRVRVPPRRVNNAHEVAGSLVYIYKTGKMAWVRLGHSTSRPDFDDTHLRKS